MNTEESLNTLIANQRKAIRLYLMLAAIVFSLGIILLISLLLLGPRIETEAIKVILGIVSCLISSTGLIPMKELIRSRDKLQIFKVLKNQLSSANITEKEKIESLVWEAIKKIATG